ncbi:transcriptional adapter 2A isoform X2 [Teleopsis dalmanni]|uniref:transcriptional adapter 2A isoform X2 n=1 Tax=Teleopsis dalmanni TaxID=139649 RepID=UPI0018CEF1C7|nr:transcriptional adapter 2A isoform X2 [Teleopsis dalmanni]
MTFLGPVDMVEEDAADLQFPKDMQVNHILESGSEIVNLSDTNNIVYKDIVELRDEQIFEDKDSFPKCSICEAELCGSYIKCANCDCLLCLVCFSNGREIYSHTNNHAYIVISDEMQVFPNSNCWTAREEHLLLNTLKSKGYGNWEAVECAFNFKRSAEECRKHYHDCYFGDTFEKSLGLTHLNETYFAQRMPYLIKMFSVDPPRFDESSSIQFHMMSGYRCARGDFDIPFDNTAERLLTAIEDDQTFSEVDYKGNTNTVMVEEELKCALVCAYNNRLKERKRRYKIIRDHGLIVSNRTLGWILKYADAFGSDANCIKFLSFVQVMKPIAFDKLLESLKYFKDLQKSLFRLYELRQNGVRTLEGGQFYFKSKQERHMSKDHRIKIAEQYKYNQWRKLIPSPKLFPIANITDAVSSMKRKKPKPLDITGLPYYVKLTDAERSLCSLERISPQAFLNYKSLLMAENVKIGQLRLADARRLIKIDVNKTRKMYDFLIENGLINKPS